jgi:hypothetical protein
MQTPWRQAESAARWTARVGQASAISNMRRTVSDEASK